MSKRKFYIDFISVIICIILSFIASQIKDSTISFWVWLLAFVIGIRSKAVEGIHDTIQDKSLNVEFLMVLSAVGAFFLKDYKEGIILIVIFAVSGVLETLAQLKSEKSLSNLLSISPQTAILLEQGKQTVVEVEKLEIDQILLVRVGDLVPIDGIVITGETELNQATITGESVPVFKKAGDTILSGSINVGSPIEMKVTALAKESTVQRIVEFVKKAQESNSKQETFIKRFEKYYVYVVLLLSISVIFIPYLLNIWSFEQSFYRGVVLLVVASPCALVASITPVMLSTISFGASNGLLIKGSTAIEQVSQVDTLVLDKTGTLTKGELEVVEVKLDSKYLDLVVSAESTSSHPIASAIVNHFYDYKKISNLDIKEIAGKGISLTYLEDTYLIGRFPLANEDPLKKQIEFEISLGFTLVLVFKNNRCLGYIKLMDGIRDASKSTIAALNKMNLKTVLLSGDQYESVKILANSIGISEFKGNCMPSEKSDYIQSCQSQGHKVAMVGDGINDAMALSLADVGIAMGEGSNVAIESADVVLLNSNVENLSLLFSISKKAKKIALMNVIFSLSVIILLVLFNVFELIDLPFGVVFHEGSTILVILNGLRMLKKS